ncbi:MAG: hypothetical protein M3R30_04700 [Candidatus Eremiobacteraeota bacterium]|nr:hypothetical protein [Candidatus Eremiobacteraeota bacterium]
MTRGIFVAAVAALALLPVASPAAGNLMSNPAHLDLALSKKDLAVVMITHIGGGPIHIHSTGCPMNRIATVRNTEVIRGTSAVSQLKVWVKGQFVGSCTLHFGTPNSGEMLAVPVTVGP